MAKVGIVMGSDSDMPIMAKAADVLKELGIDFDMTIISAHREPEEFFAYAKGAEEKGYKVIIAGAGKAAHLPGMCAAIFPMPVIGIPMKTSDLGGVDSLYSIVQMPTGIPVATVAINGAANAGILAAKMLATSDKRKESVMDYKNAGVDIEAGYKSVELMKKYVQGTMRPEVLTNLGGFSGAFSLKKFMTMENPTLVSGTDGVGTKLKVAFLMDKHDTVGIDCVAMCVNDIACAGGEPLFFLDYIACGKNFPEKIASIVSGVAEGCKQSEAALIGGETAEMPGFYPEDEYDLAGFAVGIVDEKDLITGKDIKAGDVLVGIASSGIHSNGYSLVRKVFPMEKEALNEYREELGKTLGEALITPTKIYVKALKAVKEAGITIKGCSHITGGGFYENIPRMLPEGARAVVKKDSYEVPAIFRLLAKEGNIAEEMMYNTYNMGIGMMLALDPKDAEKAIEALKAVGEEAYVVGSVEAGEKGVTLC